MSVEAAADEAVAYALMESGALGTETSENNRMVTAYFNQVPDRQRVREQLLQALQLYELPSSAVREMNLREVADRDWLGEWKKSWQPVAVGEHFIIAPPWAEDIDNHGRIAIRIEPGMAFGTGTHETTRLCLRAIEKYFKGGRFLDVGTGTGILAIAAAKLFPDAHVEACDTDAEAVAIAEENARSNGTAQVRFSVGSVAADTSSADLVCANLTADVLISLLPTLLGVTCGSLIMSGILETQREDVTSALRQHGVTNPAEVMHDGEWIAVIV